MFSLNHVILIYQLLPAILRKELNMQFIFVGMKGIRTIFEDFSLFRPKTLYELNFNGQVQNLRHVLNDLFDPANRLIIIKDAADIDFVYIGTRPEPFNGSYYGTRSEPIISLYVGTRQEYVSANSFIIKIPNSGINQDALRAIVDKYRAAGKTYTIEIL